MKALLNTVLENEILSKEQSQQALLGLLDGSVGTLQMGALLAALRTRGESSEEIAGFAEILIEKATLLEGVPDNCIDVCGTGGDGSNSFNISTAVSLVVAAGGVPVAKHGNRSVSSQCGSADVLESLGIPMTLSREEAVESLKTNNFSFLFAPFYHPAFKKIAPLRKELGVRTIFNLLGPLLNPARTKKQVVGVFSKKFIRPMAEALDLLGVEEAMVLSSRDGMDEVSLNAITDVAHLKDGMIVEFSIDPQKLDLPPAEEGELTGGSIQKNREILLELFNGKQGAKQNIVALNAGLAFLLAGEVQTIGEGILKAKDVLDSQKVLTLLKKMKGDICTLS